VPIRDLLPERALIPLLGNRRRYGLKIDFDDPDWKQWEEHLTAFYSETQKDVIGTVVTNAGFRVLENVSLDGKAVLEIGPGIIGHVAFWRGNPDLFVIADVRQDMLDASMAILEEQSCKSESRLIDHRDMLHLPFENESFDMVLGFNTFEHISPFSDYLSELLRVLRPGGSIVGAIPCEGGLAWGLGRFLTTRRWFKNNTSIDPDKIICWEHPNFADTILSHLDERTERSLVEYWPCKIPMLDVNLVAKFVYTK
jgi:SAM-dependent methyltransferase